MEHLDPNLTEEKLITQLSVNLVTNEVAEDVRIPSVYESNPTFTKIARSPKK